MNQVILKAQADGNNWDYWAEEASVVNDSTSETVKKFAEQYVLPYIIYHNYRTKGNSVIVYLNDGSYFQSWKGDCLDFLFDTNGDRKPNIGGREQFRFLYCPEAHAANYQTGKFISYNNKLVKTREEALENCKKNGYYCSGLLAIDGWQFKDDYPYHI